MSDSEPVILKYRHSFSFVDGSLTVLGDGYVGKGDGWFTFDEDTIELHPHDDRAGSYFMAKIPMSELIELRDFLNKRFPINEQLKKCDLDDIVQGLPERD